MFIRPTPDALLTQGDIIDDCPLVAFDLTAKPPVGDDLPKKWWTTRVVVLTQACDLNQGKVDVALVAQVHDAQALVDSGLLKGPTIRDQLRRHLVFGWYFLPAVTTRITLPESVIDLRDLHSVPRAFLEQLASGGERVASLASPYREHLAQHFAVTYMRVALPEPYPTQS